MLEFFHTFEPQAIAASFGPLQIHWYGLTMVLGMIAGLGCASRLVRRYGLTTEGLYDLGFYLIIFGLLGARLYAVLLEWPFYAQHPQEIIAVWHGGLAIHGAIAAGLLTVLVYARRKKQSWLVWADILAPAIALGQAIGRWGNYFNQELFGRPTALPWGIPISFSHRPEAFERFTHFHPTFLYESLLNLLNFLLLYCLHRYRQQLRLPSGSILAVYLFDYAVIRVLMEQLRIDTTAMVGGIRLPIIASFVLLVVGVSLLWRFGLTSPDHRSIL